MRVGLNPCYLLHRWPFRETSLIAEIFSRGHGRISLVAKGARRAKNRQRFLFQPLRPLNVAWSIRSDLGTLVQVEAAGPAPDLSGPALIAAFYINELLMRLLHKHEAHAELFDSYRDALVRLDAGEDHEPVLRIFEKHLLNALGYGLVLDHEVGSGRALEPGRRYCYRPEWGPIEELREEPGSVLVSGATLLSLDSEQLHGPDQLQEAKKLMRATLARHLGTRPLASRELYRQYVQNRDPADTTTRGMPLE